MGHMWSGIFPYSERVIPAMAKLPLLATLMSIITGCQGNLYSSEKPEAKGSAMEAIKSVMKTILKSFNVCPQVSWITFL